MDAWAHAHPYVLVLVIGWNAYNWGCYFGGRRGFSDGLAEAERRKLVAFWQGK